MKNWFYACQLRFSNPRYSKVPSKTLFVRYILYFAWSPWLPNPWSVNWLLSNVPSSKVCCPYFYCFLKAPSISVGPYWEDIFYHCVRRINNDLVAQWTGQLAIVIPSRQFLVVVRWTINKESLANNRALAENGGFFLGGWQRRFTPEIRMEGTSR